MSDVSDDNEALFPDETPEVDDPVEVLVQSTVWQTTEAEASGDQTELSDAGAPTPAEEAAVVERIGIDVADEDEFSTGLPAGTDVEDGAPDDLLEAELTAISEGDPETAALLAEDLARERRRPDDDT